MEKKGQTKNEERNNFKKINDQTRENNEIELEKELGEEHSSKRQEQGGIEKRTKDHIDV